ncbi:hypothetical protein PCANC_02628 [Puccinia coronata f. sp. avenae]|uniref:Uncharacterized protein n=1 Tax=Puccinia coronata f. sp. avenae TaxID=200324 RepID=A0A2N5W5L8_9BASI|nr:hypothetical protein PCANC_02628 [Puccinia coronata f. sp. avenae]
MVLLGSRFPRRVANRPLAFQNFHLAVAHTVTTVAVKWYLPRRIARPFLITFGSLEFGAGTRFLISIESACRLPCAQTLQYLPAFLILYSAPSRYESHIRS